MANYFKHNCAVIMISNTNFVKVSMKFKFVFFSVFQNISNGMFKKILFVILIKKAHLFSNWSLIVVLLILEMIKYLKNSFCSI